MNKKTQEKDILNTPIHALFYGTYNVQLKTHSDLKASLDNKLSLKRIKKLTSKA